jgi:hypothetical protein
MASTPSEYNAALESDWVHVFTFSGGKRTGWGEFSRSAAFYQACR